MEVRDIKASLIEKVVYQKDTVFVLGGKDGKVLLKFKYCSDCGTVYFHDKGDL